MQSAQITVKTRNSQKGRWTKPGRDGLNRLPPLLIYEAQKVIFSTCSLVPPENPILAAEHTELNQKHLELKQT